MADTGDSLGNIQLGRRAVPAPAPAAPAAAAAAAAAQQPAQPEVSAQVVYKHREFAELNLLDTDNTMRTNIVIESINKKIKEFKKSIMEHYQEYLILNGHLLLRNATENKDTLIKLFKYFYFLEFLNNKATYNHDITKTNFTKIIMSNSDQITNSQKKEYEEKLTDILSSVNDETDKIDKDIDTLLNSTF